MSHPLFKRTMLLRVLIRNRKRTSVNSSLLEDSGESFMQLTNNLQRDTYMSVFILSLTIFFRYFRLTLTRSVFSNMNFF